MFRRIAIAVLVVIGLFLVLSAALSLAVLAGAAPPNYGRDAGAAVPLRGAGEVSGADASAFMALPARPSSRLAAGPTSHSGVITTSETWDTAGNPHVLDDHVAVSSGVTLTIDPGVVVMGKPGKRLKVEGHLAAQGTLAERIIFTSWDDSGPDQWEGLSFDGVAGGGTGHLRYATVRYGGDDLYVLNATAGEVRLEHCRVHGALDRGLYTSNGRVVIDDTTFASNGIATSDGGLMATAGSVMTVTGSTFENNAGYGLYTDGTQLWLSDTHFTGNGNYPLRTEAHNLHRALSGNTFSGNTPNRLLTHGTMEGSATLSNSNGLAAYELQANLKVAAGLGLTVQPGVLVMGRGGARLKVEGHLDALGTSAEPITFTSTTDSGPDEWAGLWFDGVAGGGTGHLDHSTVRYGGDNIYVLNLTAGELRVENSSVLSALHCGLVSSNGRLVIHDTTFAGNGYSVVHSGLLATSGSVMTVTGSTFENNAGYGLYTDGAELWLSGSDFTGNGSYPLRTEAHNLHRALSGHTFSGNIPNRLLTQGTMEGSATFPYSNGLEAYELQGNLKVAAGLALTVQPGVLVRGRGGGQLKVEGHLDALGTITRPITFTSAMEGGTGEWPGLSFDGVAGGGTGHLRYATVRYAVDNIHVLNVTAGEVRLENSTVRSAPGRGLLNSNGRVVIQDTTFTSIGDATSDVALLATVGSVMTVTGSTFENNAGYGLYTDGAELWLSGCDFTGNGNYPLRTEAHNLHRALSGHSFSSNTPNRLVTQGTMEGSATFPYSNGLEAYELQGNLKVAAGLTLTVQPGVLVMGRAGKNLQVEGCLEAVGTSTRPITFTSDLDSAAGQWGGLVFEGSPGDGTAHLSHATVRYGMNNIYVHNVTAGEVRIESSSVRSAQDKGLTSSNGQVVIHDTTFASNGDSTTDSALLATAGSVITLTGSTFDGNAGYGVQAADNNTLLRVSGGSISGNGAHGVYVPVGLVSVSITGARIVGNAGDGFDHNASLTPVMRLCQIYDNGGLGVRNRKATICLDAAYNYWGDCDGPNDASAADDGCMGPVSNATGGEEVSDDVDYFPWAGAYPIALSIAQTDACTDVIHYTAAVSDCDGLVPLTWHLAFSDGGEVTGSGGAIAGSYTLLDPEYCGNLSATLTVSDGFGCILTHHSNTIDVNQPPDIETFSIAQTGACTDVIDYAAALSDCDGLGTLDWRLAFSDGGEVTGNGGAVAGSYALQDPAYCGTIHATLTVTDDQGCVVIQDSNTVDVNQPPEITTFSIAQTDVCTDVVDYAAALSDCDGLGTLTWLLALSDGGEVTGSGGSIAGSYALQDPAYCGNIDATLIVTDDHGCGVFQDSNTVDVNQPPQITTFSIAQTDVCTDVVDYAAALSDCDGLGTLTWLLAFSDGGEVSGIGGTVAGSYTVLDPVYCGSIDATLTVTDDHGCVVIQASNAVDINQPPQISGLTLAQTSPSRPVLDYSATITDRDDPGALTWQLDFSDGGMVMGAGATVAGSYALQDPAYAGNIHATLTVTDDQDCAVTADSNTVDVNQPPELGTVTPSSGSVPAGVTTYFTTTWKDANGWEDLKHCYFHIGDSASIVGSVTLLYNAAKSKLWLRSDDGTAWTGGFAPGSANTLENGQAIVHCSQTTAQGSGDTLSVAWAIEFKPGFEGGKKLGLKCKDRSKAKAKGKWKGILTITP
jgi:hypothetical protein